MHTVEKTKASKYFCTVFSLGILHPLLYFQTLSKNLAFEPILNMSDHHFLTVPQVPLFCFYMRQGEKDRGTSDLLEKDKGMIRVENHPLFSLPCNFLLF